MSGRRVNFNVRKMMSNLVKLLTAIIEEHCSGDVIDAMDEIVARAVASFGAERKLLPAHRIK